ncbi:hypothetical protein DFJ67_5804 [Asanoa ferruginea]|uniref:VWFA domain-containing protein n=1 Tax=Asanoa ferruginea TaxID=53367 RepID=A0A3E0A0R4_9ACTN|nr:hypothetical protein [Asanoa ferruginea]REF99760.1 hypothetical protein DFJ67_5804 [Asanoa ferruginea]GIF52471.1 hypothetical protein Afe04nite_70100 [Asanoa ferruginea]
MTVTQVQTPARHRVLVRERGVLDALEQAAAEDRARHHLALYYRALTGKVCSLIPYDGGANPWERADTEAEVWLPAQAPLDEHFAFTSGQFFQVAMTHRAMHERFGSFRLELERDELLFRRLRPADIGDPGVPALERLAGLFGHSALGVHMFATCEDIRIDAATARLFPGVAGPLRAVQHGALHDRPETSVLSPRAAAIEALIRFSLGGSKVLAPNQLAPTIEQIVAIARLLRDPASTVESSVEAALRICHLLIEQPDVGMHRTVRELRFADLDGDAEAMSPLDLATLPARMAGAEGLGPWYHHVRYRDWPGPRYVGVGEGDLSLADVLDLAARRAEGQGEVAPGPDAGDDDLLDIEGEERPPAEEKPQEGSRPDERPADSGMTLPPPTSDAPDLVWEPALHAKGRREFTYPEWDRFAGRVRPDHTLVRLLTAPANSSEHDHFEVLARYGHIVSRLVRAIERISPQSTAATRRTSTGDDLDLDATIDAMIDLRLKTEPSDHLYTDLRRPRREVAVAFAIDLSGSTALWLPPDAANPGVPIQRILDLQRDAVSLVAEALNRVGDSFGIYGFSGTGREDVRLSVVKDIEERLTPVVWRRLGSMVPDDTTRIGAVIRHLTHRLQQVDAATKILVVVTDGRPFDVDYGQKYQKEYGREAEFDYAVADTAHALAESRSRAVNPLLITVDPYGENYLAPVCDPHEYHVIGDPKDLPEALADIYLAVRRATMGRPTAAAAMPPVRRA